MKKAFVSFLLVAAAIASSVAFTNHSPFERSNKVPGPQSCCLDEISRDG